MTARVSIIIPAFNAQPWIRATIDSALGQTWPHCEVVVVDDGSTDGTGIAVEEEYGARVKVIRQANAGLAAARNAGLAAATGEFIQFLDADDLLLPHKVETHVAFLQARPSCSVVYSDFALFSSDPRKRRGHLLQRGFAEGDVTAQLLAGNFIVVHAALARRAAILEVGGFDQRFYACEDYDLWLRIAANGARFGFTPSVLVLYRRHRGSMSSDWRRQLIATREVVEHSATYLPKTPVLEDIRERRMRFLRSAAAIAAVGQAALAALQGDFGRARTLLQTTGAS